VNAFPDRRFGRVVETFREVLENPQAVSGFVADGAGTA